MRIMKQVSIGALVCGATVLVIGAASALPLGARHASFGLSAENAVNGLLIQTACGPGGCGTGSPQRPRGGGGGGPSWGHGFGLGVDIIENVPDWLYTGPPNACETRGGHLVETRKGYRCVR